MSRAHAAARQRMSGTARRSQLLDVAADAVLAGGMADLTMERLAEQAGVSKALPYTHFESIDHVLVSLYEREGKSYLTVAIGCTGGHHRSVALACKLAGMLEEQGIRSELRHRDVER